MDELIVKFKNLSPFSKKNVTVQLQSACLRRTGYTVVFAIAAGDEDESGYGHWSEYQYTVHNVKI